MVKVEPVGGVAGSACPRVFVDIEFDAVLEGSSAHTLILDDRQALGLMTQIGIWLGDVVMTSVAEETIKKHKSRQASKVVLEDIGWCPDCGNHAPRPWQEGMPPCEVCGSAAYPLRAADLLAFQRDNQMHIQAREEAEARVYELARALQARGVSPEELQALGMGQSATEVVG